MKLLLELKKDWNEQFRPYAITKPFSFEDEDLTNCFAQGTFDFVEKCQKLNASSFGMSELYDWTSYARFIGDELLNSEYCILPGSEFKRMKYSVLGSYAKDCKLFVRPNTGYKLFNGQLIDITEIDSFSDSYSSDLIIISKPKEMLGEWRFVVEQNDCQILGLSLYRYQGDLVSIDSCPPKMIDYVTSVAKNIKQFPAPLIVIDVAQLPDFSFKIIELNSFSSCGLYAMKPQKIVDYIKSI